MPLLFSKSRKISPSQEKNNAARKSLEKMDEMPVDMA
jgi:hypothetical protein